MSFDWFDLIVLFGILQGLVSSVLLIRKKPFLINNKLLVIVLIVFSLLSFKILLHTLGLWDTSIFRYFPLGIDLLIQPALFLYICSLTEPGFKLEKTTWLHFVPPFIFVIHALFIYILVMTKDSNAAKDIVAENWHYNAVKTFEDYLSITSGVVYGYFIARKVSNYRQWIEQNISDSNYDTLKWLKSLLLITCILGSGLIVNVLLNNILDAGIPFFYWQIFYIYLTGVIYYIGMKGYLTNHLALHNKEILIQKAEAKHKYETDELKFTSMLVMNHLVNKQSFLNSELTLQSLAGELQLSPALVSAAINNELGKSFRTLINELRVGDVKLKLIDKKFAHLSILGIALESGFNSEASFYRIFKSTTALSPKEYIQKNKS